MATSIFDKIRTLTLGNLHELLDSLNGLNTVAGVKQGIRDVETAKEKIADQAVTAKSRVGRLEAEAKHLNETVAKDDANIDFLLTDGDPSNDDLAVPIQKRIDRAKEDIELRTKELETQRVTAKALAEATAKLEAKCQELVRSLRKLEQMEQTAKAQEQAAKALNQAAAASATGDNASVDNLQRQLQERADVAQGKFDRAMGAMASVDDDVETAKAKAAILARRAKLAGGTPNS